MVFEAPPPFLEVLKGMQSPGNWRHTFDRIFSQWLHGEDNTRLVRFVLAEAITEFTGARARKAA